VPRKGSNGIIGEDKEEEEEGGGGGGDDDDDDDDDDVQGFWATDTRLSN